MFKNSIAEITSRMTSRAMSRLRNNDDVLLSREEMRNVHFSFSQFGEDRLFEGIVKEMSPEMYYFIDVGCYNPIVHSNTLLLHKMGWQGINIDIDAEKIDQFNKLRPADHNLLCAVSNYEGELEVATYNSALTSRVLTPDDPNNLSTCGEQPKKITKIACKSLNTIIAESPFTTKEIGYLNIDAEGHDMKILTSLDFSKNTPGIISVEVMTPTELVEIDNFLTEQDYNLIGIAGFTFVFKNNKLGADHIARFKIPLQKHNHI